MCGIAGIYAPSYISDTLQPALVRMTNAVAHRGPDGEGFFSQAQDGIYLGHRRLSIIDLSANAAQPMWDFEKRYAVIFNGEIYNYKALRSEIPDYPYATASDSEVILAAYRAWGTECFKRFNGIFAMALWDAVGKELLICRDAIGVKPLYYYRDDHMFLFGSEIRSLLASGFIPRSLNRNALREYLTYQSTLRHETLVSDIMRLAPGHYIRLKKDQVQPSRYWNLYQHRGFNITDKTSVQREVKEKVFTAVRRQMVSDVPISAFLSGGIDSSVMVAAMAVQSDQPVETFTVGFSEKKFDESGYARLLAKKYNTRHHEIHLRQEELVAELPGMVSRMDNPSGDGINSFIVSRAVRQAGIKVAISGLGGDELFAGYDYATYYKRILDHRRRWALAGPLRKCIAAMTSVSASGKMRKASDLLRIHHPDISTLYPVLRSMYAASEIRDLTIDRDFRETGFERELKIGRDDIMKFPVLSQFSIGDILGYTEGVLLKDSDQMSMANSIEMRVPFFDTDLVEYALAIPDAYKNPISPKKLLVDAMHEYLPEEIWNRKKMGFTLPWEVWMKHELKSFCDEAIHRIADREIFNTPRLLHYWDEFLKGNKSVSWLKLWSIVALESWISTVLEDTAHGTG